MTKVNSGAIALFDEKYGDGFGFGNRYSMELCGGCHVSNSANIGLFKIEAEEECWWLLRKTTYQALVP